MKLRYLSLVFIIASQVVLSQSYFVKHYSEEDGLPSQRVYSTTQDSLGQMWFALEGGMTMYNGHSWRVFNSINSAIKYDCLKTKVDDNKKVWALGKGSTINVSYYDGMNWQSLPQSEKLSDNRSYTSDFDIINNEADYSIVVGTMGNGVFLYHNEEWHHYDITNGLPSSIVYSVTAIENKFFIGTQNGLVIIEGKSINDSYHDKIQMPRKQILAVTQYSDRILVLNKKGIGYIEDDKYYPINISFSFAEIKSNILVNEEYYYILPIDTDRVVVGGLFNKYILDLSTQSIQLLGKDKGFNEDGATDAFRDRENNFWFTGLRGINKLPSMRFRSYSQNEGLLEDEVTSIVESAPNSYALGQLNNIAFLENGIISSIQIKNYDPDNPKTYRVLDLCKDELGNIWFAFSSEGFGKITADKKIVWYENEDFRKEGANSIETDKLGNLYALTNQSVFQINSGVFQEIEMQDEFFHSNYRKLFFSPDNKLYIATMNHGIIWRDHNNEWKSITSSGNRSANNVYSMFFEDNIIYAGSLDGLYIVEADTLKKFSDSGFQIDRPVYFINKDTDSNFWFGTNSGVVKWNGKQYYHYSRNHGILGYETNRDAGFVASNGDVLIGTNKGLSIYSSELDLLDPLENPKAVITYFETDGKVHSPREDVEVEFDNNNLVFHFNALTFIDEENVEYYVQLEGFDDNWFVPEKSIRPNIRYTNIPPGDYTFKVKAKNSLGIWSDVASTGNIMVLNPFYLSWWFFILVPGILVVLLYYFNAEYRRQQYTEKLEGVVVERNKELIASKKRYEQMFNANHAVMLLIDSETHSIIDANPSAISYYGLEIDNFGGIDFRAIDGSYQYEIESSNYENDEIRKYYTSLHKDANGEFKSVEVYLNSLNIDDRKLYYAIIHDITERKLAEEALIESEEKYRLLVDHMHDGVIVIQNRKILFVNNAISKILGYSVDEMNGMDFLELVAEHQRDRVLAIYSGRLKNSEVPSQYDIQIHHKDGVQGIYVNLRVGVFKYEGKLATIASVQDITEKKKQEETLKQLYIAVDQSPSGIIITDKDGLIEYVNPKCSELTGYENEELVGVNPSILKSETNPIELYKELWATISAGKVWRGDMLNKRKDDSFFWVNAIISPIKNNSGVITHYLAIENDITFEKFAREEIEKNQNLLNSIVSNLPVVFFVLDKNGSINLVKGRYLATSGIDANSVLGEDVLSYFEGFSDIKLDVERALRGEEFTRNLVFYGVQFEVSFAPLYDDNNNLKGTMGIAYDLTERFKVEKELKRAKEEAEKSDRLKSDFLAQMSHEIRTPINSILSFSSLLKEELYKNVPEQLRESFQIIERGGRRLIRTIDLILNMSQIQTGTYQPNFSSIDLDQDVLSNVVAELNSIAEGKNIKLVYNKQTQNSIINGDSYTLGQIFINLVDNAIKYTRKGTVTLALDNIDGKTVVKVKDTGEGIAKEFIPRLFSPFAQEETGYSRRFEGTGLGLALVKNYVEINNARIEVSSRKGRGTTFTVTFNSSRS